MSDVDELGKLDAAHQGGTGRDTEFAAEQAKLLDEILASADLGSPATPAVRSIDQTGDAELSHDEGRAALASAPSQPQEHVLQEEVLPVSPPSYEASTSAAAAFTITPLNEDDEAVEPDAGHQPETTGRDAGPAGEEATRLDEIPAAADLGSPGTPEAGTADDTSDAEAPHGQGQAEMGSTPELPRDQAVTVWPSAYSAPAYGAPAYSAPAYGGPAYGTPAYGAPTSAVAAFTDATTPGKNDEAGELDTARQAATGSDAESAAEDATQIEETPSLADLTSPGTAEDRSFDETSDAEAPHDEGRAEIKPAPEEPQQQVATTWPSAYGALTSAIAALTDTTTPSKDDEAGEPEAEAPLQAETGGDAESSADEETELEKTPAAAELASPETPEARPVDETSDAEGPDDEGQFETGPAPEEPQEEPVTAWPGAYSAPTYSAPTYSTPTYSAPTYSTPTATVASFTDGAMPSKDGEAGEPEAPLKAETGSETESAAEEATQVEETPVGADLASPGTPEDRSVDETSSAEEPDDEGHSEPAPPPGPAQEEAVTMSPAAYSEPAGAPAAFTNTTMPVGETRESRRRSRVSPAILAVLAAVFLLAALGTGFLAVKQASTARQWRQRDRNEVALNRGLSARDSVLAKDLASTHAAITSLNSQTSKLNGQVKSLQAQLSAVASANRKALNHNGLLGQLTNQASTVSNELSTCVGDMSSLQTEINNDLSKPSYKDPHLQSNTHSADQVCTTARQESQQLQSTLSGA